MMRKLRRFVDWFRQFRRELSCGPDHEWRPALYQGIRARRCWGCERTELLSASEFYAQFGESLHVLARTTMGGKDGAVG